MDSSSRKKWASFDAAAGVSRMPVSIAFEFVSMTSDAEMDGSVAKATDASREDGGSFMVDGVCDYSMGSVVGSRSRHHIFS